MRRSVVVVGFVVAVAVFLASIGGSARAQDSDLEATVAALQTQVADLQTAVAELQTGARGPEPRATTAPAGPPSTPVGVGSSRDAPLAIGESAAVGDFRVRVVRVDDDAEAAILADNQFNEPARPGHRMVMVTLELTYLGADTGSAFWGLVYEVVGDRGLAYADTAEDAKCGTVPGGLLNAPDMDPGGTVEANVCWQVPAEEVDSLVLILGPFGGSNSERVFFALRD